MLMYSMMMLACAVLFLALGISIYRGRTDLIHDYHRTHIAKEALPAYGRAFSRGMFSMSLTLFLTGIIPLSDGSEKAVLLSLAVMLAGFLISFVILAKVQKKYNGGFF